MSFSDDASTPSLHSTQVSSDSAKSRHRRAPRMEVIPGKSLGPFRLGAPLHNIVAMIQGEAPGLPQTSGWAVGALPNRSLRICLDEWCIVLTFHHRTQRLAMAEACNLNALELVHTQGLLCGAGATPTFVRLYDVLGPTFAGKLDSDTGEYMLSYAGLDVVFRIPAEYRGSYANDEHPITLPDGTTPVALALVVREETESSLIAPVVEPFAQPWATVRVEWGKGITLAPAEPRASSHHPVTISFGSSPQDIISALGAPELHVVKGDERLRVQGGSDDATTAPSMYGLGYPGYGIDFLFSGADDSLVKIVLFGGVSGHDAFLRYNRCFFEVPFEAERTGRQWLGKLDAAPSPDFPSQCVTPFTKWAQVREWIKSEASGELPRPLLATTADGTLNLWAMSGIAFAVSQTTDEIATVTLTQPAPLGLERAVADGTAPAPILAFRTPFGSTKPSPEAGPAPPPPPRRAAVSGEFDDCEDDIDGFFLANKAGSGPEADGPEVAAPVATAGGMPGPTVLRKEERGETSPTHYRFAYPGFSEEDGNPGQHQHQQALPPPLSSMAAPIASIPEEDSSLMPGAGAATMTFADTEPAGSNNYASGAAEPEYQAQDTDYADDAFESLQPTEQQLHRARSDAGDASAPAPQPPSPQDPDTADQLWRQAEAAAEDMGPAEDMEPAADEEPADAADEGAEDEDEADIAPPNLGVAPSNAPRVPFSYAMAARKGSPPMGGAAVDMSGGPEATESHVDPATGVGESELEDPGASGEQPPAAEESHSPQDTSNGGVTDAEGTSATTQSRSCSPAFADDDMTPPVTPPMGGQAPPKPGMQLVAPKKGKKKKGRR